MPKNGIRDACSTADIIDCLQEGAGICCHFNCFGSILFMINCRWGRHKRRRWMMAIKVWAVTSVVKLILWSWRQKRWWWKMVLDLSFEKHCKVPTFIFPLAKSVPNLSNLVLGNLSLVGNLQQISRWWAICSSASGQIQSASAVHYAYICVLVAMQSIVHMQCI